MNMNAKKVPQCHARCKLGLVIAIASMLAILPGFALATLLPAVVGANIATNGIVGSWLTQSNGPHIVNLLRDDRTAGVWTDFGMNKAGAWISATPYGGYVVAKSRWEDQLTILTPDVALDAWVNLRFSVRLEGHLEAYEDDFFRSHAFVDYKMSLNHHGSWVTRPVYGNGVAPTPHSTAGGYAERDVDEILFGEIAIQNGHTFNLSSQLTVNPESGSMGPAGIGWAESSFDNSAEWMGGSVWVNGAEASSFVITSASGYNYGPRSTHNDVPEPAGLALLGVGLAMLRFRSSRSV
ncbi:MAG: hypothetical protein IPO43_14895 [Rhodoferax sp.]|nr:hypothetical protein [Rhodoferax sp.]